MSVQYHDAMADASSYQEALVRFRHVYKIYRIADTGEPLVLIDALDSPGSKARNVGPLWDRIAQ